MSDNFVYFYFTFEEFYMFNISNQRAVCVSHNEQNCCHTGRLQRATSDLRDVADIINMRILANCFTVRISVSITFNHSVHVSAHLMITSLQLQLFHSQHVSTHQNPACRV